MEMIASLVTTVIATLAWLRKIIIRSYKFKCFKKTMIININNKINYKLLNRFTLEIDYEYAIDYYDLDYYKIYVFNPKLFTMLALTNDSTI